MTGVRKPVSAKPCTLRNFGRNQTWRVRCCYRPGTEQDVLDILERHRNGQVRAVGALHSWSDVAAGSDAILDMSGLVRVEPLAREGLVRVGAGCRLKDLLKGLHAATDRTLPTLGAITAQTISGAAATGTHGSGRQSLSHFIAALRVAAYDAAGTPKIFEYESGEALRAARCSLGCMGIVVSLDLHTVPKYLVGERLRRHASLDSVLNCYGARPLTQFVLVPYCWTYMAWEREAVAMRRRTAFELLQAWWARVYYRIGVDILFHVFLKAMLAFGDRAVKG